MSLLSFLACCATISLNRYIHFTRLGFFFNYSLVNEFRLKLMLNRLTHLLFCIVPCDCLSLFSITDWLSIVYRVEPLFPFTIADQLANTHGGVLSCIFSHSVQTNNCTASFVKSLLFSTNEWKYMENSCYVYSWQCVTCPSDDKIIQIKYLWKQQFFLTLMKKY